jgi:hypothetical protein
MKQGDRMDTRMWMLPAAMGGQRAISYCPSTPSDAPQGVPAQALTSRSV